MSSTTDFRAAPTGPAPADVRRLREAAGLTLEQATVIVRATLDHWLAWESDNALKHAGLRMPQETWELFLTRINAMNLSGVRGQP
jgi:hypothetical protein